MSKCDQCHRVFNTEPNPVSLKTGLCSDCAGRMVHQEPAKHNYYEQAFWSQLQQPMMKKRRWLIHAVKADGSRELVGASDFDPWSTAANAIAKEGVVAVLITDTTRISGDPVFQDGGGE
jgi:hypothetical protein